MKEPLAQKKVAANVSKGPTGPKNVRAGDRDHHWRVGIDGGRYILDVGSFDLNESYRI